MRAGFFAGGATFVAALRLLRSNSQLWVWCALPIAVNVATFTLAAVIFFANLDWIVATVQAWFSVSDPTVWYQWLWVGPLKGLAWLVRGILLLLFAVAIYFLFTVVGAILASPFLDVLSQGVERVRTGGVSEEPGFLRAVRMSLHMMFQEAQLL